MNIVIIGAPGSGKDTLANRLVKEQGYSVINTGALFREAANNKTELGLMARDQYWGKGLLCPDNIVNKITKEYIRSNNLKDKLIFNGYPRQVGQAEYLSNIVKIDLAIELMVDKDIAIQRLLGRGRSDDKKEIISVRLDQFNEKTEPVLEFYRNLNECVYYGIDTDHLPKIIYEETLVVLKKLGTND